MRDLELYQAITHGGLWAPGLFNVELNVKEAQVMVSMDAGLETPQWRDSVGQENGAVAFETSSIS